MTTTSTTTTGTNDPTEEPMLDEPVPAGPAARRSGRRRPRLLRKLALVVALAVPGGLGAAHATAPAADAAPTCTGIACVMGPGVVGGCTPYCSGTYRLTNPAVFRGVSTRADLGTIGISLDRGYRGPVTVTAWVWSQQQQRFTASATQTFGDNYSSSYVGSPGTGLLTLRPASKGWHHVHVRIAYADGTVVFNGYPGAYSNYFWNAATGAWAWGTHTMAYL